MTYDDEASILTDRRTGWCAALMLVPWVPMILSMAAMTKAPRGLDGYAPLIAFLASLALMLAIDVLCIGFLVYSLRKERIRTPALAKWLIWGALLLLAVPPLFLSSWKHN